MSPLLLLWPRLQARCDLAWPSWNYQGHLGSKQAICLPQWENWRKILIVCVYPDHYYHTLLFLFFPSSQMVSGRNESTPSPGQVWILIPWLGPLLVVKPLNEYCSILGCSVRVPAEKCLGPLDPNWQSAVHRPDRLTSQVLWVWLAWAQTAGSRCLLLSGGRSWREPRVHGEPRPVHLREPVSPLNSGWMNAS